MCDMDSGSDFDVSSDVGGDVGPDYDSDVSPDSLFEGLDSVDETSYESFDDESEIIGVESAADVGVLESLAEFSDDDDLEYFENEAVTDLSSLEDIEHLDIEQETEVSDSLDIIDTLESIEEFESLGESEIADETADDDSPMVLTRDITSEIIESRDKDTEITLDNYRDNLRAYGVAEKQIEEFVEQEREKINAEFESLDRGDTSSNIYYIPTDWKEVANSLMSGQAERLGEEEGLDSVDETSYESFDDESEITGVESVEDVEVLDSLAEFSDDDLEFFENEEVTDLSSLEDIEDVDMYDENIEHFDTEQETEASASFAIIDTLENVEEFESFEEPEIVAETDETADDDSPMVLTRDITPEIMESRDRDTEVTLDNYRDNLRAYGVAEEQIEEFVEQEREKINTEFESLDRGDTSSNIYYIPTDWKEVANSLVSGQTERLSAGVPNELDIEQEAERTNAELQELNINYDEIYEGIQQEAIEESFADIHIDADPERLDTSLANFNVRTWENLTIDEQKGSMETLADYVVDIIGFEHPPRIEYYNNEQKGDFGGYSSSTNTLHINEYMLYNSDEAADTIAHELWHAHQYECAINPQNTRAHQYQYNFENYIPPELGQEAYEAQLVETEARAFAAQFKDRLSMIKGRSI